MKYQATPNDSRYVPFTQQSMCCVPASIAMIMYRNGIPLIPIEELGYHLGLVVPPRDKDLFYKPRVSDTPPTTAGYGTQIQNPDYEPNKAFAKLHIPLTMGKVLADDIKSADDLVSKLQSIEDEDDDAILCFNYAVAHNEDRVSGGHAVVFDRIIDGKIRIVDAWNTNPKWQLFDPERLFDAIKKHGNGSAGGIWRFTKND